MSTTPEHEPAAEPQDASGAEQAAEPAPAARPAGKPAARLIFDDPLNQQSSDDTDRGWGERPSGGDSAADLARFLDEKPPHHL
ncbi:hypothetical protein BX264_2867 [Streptomyces sp. 2333.5]|uniref:hypothetical protein n=1 Tax=unclassified Streptomyces TaxID=2593676 RepID=UPI00089AA2D8|nr:MULTISPECIES: hypothetical protein [unclassified Streptomyces]PJJ02520.1 hypothetical protein BX264_2867 [Streptomyces sp. 2333.5]SED13929.1 hypothetical protein SAMN05428943_3007 [Streptomyces sp. 2314.4]SEE01295.1 hypothetical protein SAMN05428942_2970 [Streptomyces sp. 2112.2]